MCLIHLRPTHARSPSPDPIVPSRPITRGTLIVPTPPLSPESYTRTRPHSQSARLSTTGTYTRSPRASNPQIQTYSPRASRNSDLRRLSIQSGQQWEATRRKEAERERERIAEENARRKREEEADRERGYEMHQLDSQHAVPPTSSTVLPQIGQPSAPDPPTPLRTASQRRISFHDPPEKVVVFSDERKPRSTPRTSGTRLPILRNGSNYSYGDGPVLGSASSLNGSGSGGMAPPPPPSHPYPTTTPLANKPITNGIPSSSETPQKPGHRRRESSVSILNGKDGSVLERNPSGRLLPYSQSSYQAQGQGQGQPHHRASSFSSQQQQRPSGAPRRSTGNVSTGTRASADWGKDPRASRGSVGRERERIVVVDEVRGVRRREYVRFGE